MSLTDLPKTVIKELDRTKGIFLAYTKNVIKELDRTKGIFLAYTKNVIKELDRTKGIFLAYNKNVIRELDRNGIRELGRTKGIFLGYPKNVIKELDRTKGIFLAYTKNADIKREKLLSRQSWVPKLAINTQKNLDLFLLIKLLRWKEKLLLKDNLPGALVQDRGNEDTRPGPWWVG